MTSDINTVTIYMRLLGEGVSVLRPTKAIKQNATYKVLAIPGYDPEDEIWEFPPGTLVKCKYEKREGELLLVADHIAKYDVGREFLTRGIVRSGVLMLRANDALDFLKRCEEHHYVILGIDGFFLTETTTQPSLEDSIDLSASKYVGNRDLYSIASDFIKKRSSKDMYFEIVTE